MTDTDYLIRAMRLKRGPVGQKKPQGLQVLPEGKFGDIWEQLRAGGSGIPNPGWRVEDWRLFFRLLPHEYTNPTMIRGLQTLDALSKETDTTQAETYVSELLSIANTLVSTLPDFGLSTPGKLEFDKRLSIQRMREKTLKVKDPVVTRDKYLVFEAPNLNYPASEYVQILTQACLDAKQQEKDDRATAALEAMKQALVAEYKAPTRPTRPQTEQTGQQGKPKNPQIDAQRLKQQQDAEAYKQLLAQQAIAVNTLANQVLALPLITYEEKQQVELARLQQYGTAIKQLTALEKKISKRKPKAPTPTPPPTPPTGPTGPTGPQGAPSLPILPGSGTQKQAETIQIDYDPDQVQAIWRNTLMPKLEAAAKANNPVTLYNTATSKSANFSKVAKSGKKYVGTNASGDLIEIAPIATTDPSIASFDWQSTQ